MAAHWTHEALGGASWMWGAVSMLHGDHVTMPEIAVRSTTRSRFRRRGTIAVLAAGLALAAVTGCSSSNGSTLAAVAVTVSPAGVEQTLTPSGPSASASSAATPVSVTSSSTPPAPPAPAVLAVAPTDGTTAFAPNEPVTVTVTDGTLGPVTLVAEDGTEVFGAVSPDRRGWWNTTELAYDTSYTLTAQAQNAAGAPVSSTATFHTVRPGGRVELTGFPTDGMTVGVAQPIAFYFDQPVTNHAAVEQAITVTATPAQNGGFRWVDDTELRWRPENYWSAGSTVTVTTDLYGRDLGGGMFVGSDTPRSFTVGRKFVADIDNASHLMGIYVDDQLTQLVPVSMGRDNYPTYNGVHVVKQKYESKIMDSTTWGLTGAGAYRTKVAWASRISDSGEFVHAAPWSVDSQGVENVSHGCVNVSTDWAKWFYDNALPGDPVVIRGTSGPALEWWDGYGDFQLPFDQYVATS